MKKTIIKSTITIIILSILAKSLSFFVRILLARKLTPEAMNLYSLACPTMIFIITIAQLGIPCALSKVIAQHKSAYIPVKTSCIISIFTNILTTLLFLIVIPILSKYILKQPDIDHVLYAILPLIPTVTLSGLLKGYLFGIQEHVSATACQIFEEGGRILFLIILLLLNPDLSIIEMAQIAMFSITIGEISSSIYMIYTIYMQKHKNINKKSISTKLKKEHFSQLLNVCIPMTGSRFIGSITFFLEPILMIIGLSSMQANTMIATYGQLNGYVLPIITMPSFITVTLSNFLLPSFTYHHTRKNYKTAAKLFNTIILCCFLIGMGCSFICYFFHEQLFHTFYHSTNGSEILKLLAWPFALYALQPPLSSILHAVSKSNFTVLDTFIGSIVRLLCIFFLSSLFHENVLIIGLCLGMLTTTIFLAIHVGIALKKTQ